MDTHQESPKRPNNLARFAAAAAIAVGLGVGSYGIASAASGSGTTSTPTATNAAPSAPPGANAQAPWGHQRSDETPLTGDALAKVKAIAKAKVSGGTVIRVETDADGVGGLRGAHDEGRRLAGDGVRRQGLQLRQRPVALALDAAADDLDAPRLTRGEEGIRVDVVEPADEVLFCFGLGRAVDGRSPGVSCARRSSPRSRAARRSSTALPSAYPLPTCSRVLPAALGAGSSAGRAGDF